METARVRENRLPSGVWLNILDHDTARQVKEAGNTRTSTSRRGKVGSVTGTKS